MMERIELGIIQTIIFLAVAPLLAGSIKSIKAKLQNRSGPVSYQFYRDLRKLFRKESVISEHASWITIVTPYIAWSAVVIASLLVPGLAWQTPVGFAGDAIAMVYLLALGRFFTALGGLDSGSAFGGMGSSRDVALAALVEPALLMVVFALGASAGSTELGAIAKFSLISGGLLFSPVYVLALASIVIVAIAETGRIPVDNPDTHLELTMIHEGMLLEYSGRRLALMQWAAAIKQLLILTVVANLFFPWGIATRLEVLPILISLAAWGLKVMLLGVLMAVVETASAKMRLFRVPELLGVSFILGLLALVWERLVGV